MSEEEQTPPRRHQGGRWKKGVGGNPSGQKRSSATAPPPDQPAAAQPVSTGEKRDGRFTAGNPGRPKGSRNHATRLAEQLFDDQAELLVQKCVAMALDGDVQALRIAIDRLLPPRRERPLSLDNMPKIEATKDLIAASSALMEAATSGELAPGEAAALSTLAACRT